MRFRGQLWFAVTMAVCAACIHADIAGATGLNQSKNLIVNGSFDDTNSPLRAWFYEYNLPGEGPYANNHTRVSVVPSESGRQNVLCLRGAKVDSWPFEYNPESRYRITLYAKGSAVRLYAIGYKWKPGVKPHDVPDRWEMREVYRGQAMMFHGQKSGPMSSPGGSWTKGEIIFPSETLSLSDLAAKHLKQIEMVSLHIVAMGGDVYIDDVRAEEIKNAKIDTPSMNTRSAK